MDLTDVTYETFADRIGQSFHARVDDDTSVELEVIEVTRAKGENRPDNAFSVVFKGPSEPFLPQRMYDLEHAELGALAIFLVPIEQMRDGFCYEAVFTRLRPNGS